MSKMISLVVACVCLSSVAARWASADDRAATTAKTSSLASSSSECERARKAGKPCVLTMEGSDLEGGRPSHDGSTVSAAAWGKHTSLLRVRRDFLAEILKTAEDL